MDSEKALRLAEECRKLIPSVTDANQLQLTLQNRIVQIAVNIPDPSPSNIADVELALDEVKSMKKMCDFIELAKGVLYLKGH